MDQPLYERCETIIVWTVERSRLRGPSQMLDSTYVIYLEAISLPTPNELNTVIIAATSGPF